jgi:hypothetical protein
MARQRGRAPRANRYCAGVPGLRGVAGMRIVRIAPVGEGFCEGG